MGEVPNLERRVRGIPTIDGGSHPLLVSYPLLRVRPAMNLAMQRRASYESRYAETKLTQIAIQGFAESLHQAKSVKHKE